MKKTSPHYDYCVRALRQSALFKDVADDTMESMMGVLHYETAKARDTSIMADGGNHRFYILLSGRGKISVFNPETGREHILFLAGPGDAFDMISLLDGERHDSIATALEEVHYLTVPVDVARYWIEKNPEFNRTLLPYIGKQMRYLADQVEDIALYDTETRLARLILRHATENSSPTNGIDLINDLSQETLASMIGTVRVVVARHWQKWKQEDVVVNAKGRWSVSDLKTLLDKAQQQFSSTDKY